MSPVDRLKEEPGSKDEMDVQGCRVAQVVECLCSTCEVLSSNPSNAKKKKKMDVQEIPRSQKPRMGDQVLV
jgi:hypothetical protein